MAANYRIVGRLMPTISAITAVTNDFSNRVSITAAVTSSCSLVMGKSQSKSQAQVTIYVQKMF